MEQLRFENEGKNGDESGSDGETGTWAICKSYFSSFEDKAVELWERISAPFSAGKEQDMNDFLDDGEPEEGDDEGIHQVFDREEAVAAQADDEELAQYYKDKAAENNDDDSNQYADEGQSENEDDYEPAELSESEEEDEWVSDIRNKKRRGSTKKPPSKERGRQSGRRLASKNKKASYAESSDDEELGSNEPSSGSKRAILEDSDSE